MQLFLIDDWKCYRLSFNMHQNLQNWHKKQMLHYTSAIKLSDAEDKSEALRALSIQGRWLYWVSPKVDKTLVIVLGNKCLRQ